MAVYECDRCNRWVDDDWHPMEELIQGDIVCPECASDPEIVLDEERDEWMRE